MQMQVYYMYLFKLDIYGACIQLSLLHIFCTFAIHWIMCEVVI